jgi:hypothetical protein
MILSFFLLCEAYYAYVSLLHEPRGCVKRELREAHLNLREERGWRKFHHEELHNLCSSPDVIRVDKKLGTWSVLCMLRHAVLV